MIDRRDLIVVRQSDSWIYGLCLCAIRICFTWKQQGSEDHKHEKKRKENGREVQSYVSVRPAGRGMQSTRSRLPNVSYNNRSRHQQSHVMHRNSKEQYNCVVTTVHGTVRNNAIQLQQFVTMYVCQVERLHLIQYLHRFLGLDYFDSSIRFLSLEIVVQAPWFKSIVAYSFTLDISITRFIRIKSHYDNSGLE